MDFNPRQWNVLFRMLCAYRHYKHLYPAVILNYGHRDPRAVDPGQIEEVFNAFREQPNEGNDETEQPADSVVEPDPLEDSTEQDPTLDQPVTYTAHTGGVLAVVQLDNGLIASASRDETVRIWDPADPDTTIATYTGHTGEVYSVIELSDGRIASASSDETVRIWDPADL